jgi:hypothetical protein
MNRQRPSNFCKFSEKDIELDDFLRPNQARQKLQTILQRMPPVLNEFRTYFVFYHKNPEYAEYQQIFSNLQNNIGSFGTQLFELLNEIEVNTEKINDAMVCLNSMIFRERQKNRRLKRRFAIEENKNNASSELIYDYKNIYEEGYLRNWALIFSIMIVGVLIKNTYSNSSGDMSTGIKNLTSNFVKPK